MKIFDAAAVSAALRFETLIPALERMFRIGCEVPPRHVHTIAGDEIAMTSLIMPAWQRKAAPGHRRYYGVKVINIAPGNSAQGLPGLFANYQLMDADSGESLAVMEGSALTSRRTAAASALAASKILSNTPKSLLVVGTGRIALLLPQAYAAVFPLRKITIWGRDASKARALKVALDRANPQLAHLTEIASDLKTACADADIVTCATLATAPVVCGAWLAPGAHLDLIGSFTPAMRETDDDAFRDATIFVDTREALQKSGELLLPMGNGVFSAGDVSADLAQLCDPQFVRDDAPNARTIFKSVGTALEDLAAAIEVYENDA